MGILSFFVLLRVSVLPPGPSERRSRRWRPIADIPERSGWDRSDAFSRRDWAGTAARAGSQDWLRERQCLTAGNCMERMPYSRAFARAGRAPGLDRARPVQYRPLENHSLSKQMAPIAEPERKLGGPEREGAEASPAQNVDCETIYCRCTLKMEVGIYVESGNCYGPSHA